MVMTENIVIDSIETELQGFRLRFAGLKKLLNGKDGSDSTNRLTYLGNLQNFETELQEFEKFVATRNRNDLLTDIKTLVALVDEYKSKL